MRVELLFMDDCRLYQTPVGLRGVPAEALIRAALTASGS
jgi:hypothetical protein